ncbi:MAG: MBL fold metallo-hydrolase [Candidatus Sericytochromatia bacterium]|nr:MBL fold metallo-hydrolase [Candidatus Sericytochromatia bacterium]
MIFRQLFDSESSTYTYLLADDKTKEALLIDSVKEQSERDKKVINELGLKLKYLLETHVHADHITGVAKMKEYFSESKSVIYQSSGVECADIFVKDGDKIFIGQIQIDIIYTPGHTNGDVSYYTNGMVFSGDILLIRGCGRTDFQEGSPDQLYDSVNQKLFTLPDETIVYPAHDYKGMTSSSIAEEKNYNPRLANKTKKDFVEIMNNLNLPYPKKINESLPANLKCGRTNI